MSTKSKGVNNIKHKSAEDKKNDNIRESVKKLGGQEEADAVLVMFKRRGKLLMNSLAQIMTLTQQTLKKFKPKTVKK